MTTIPSTSPPGAWKRGETRAAQMAAHVTQPTVSGHHVHDGEGEDAAGPHEHGDTTARLDEHHERLLNLEKAQAAK